MMNHYKILLIYNDISYHTFLFCELSFWIIMKSFLDHIIAMKLTLDFKFIGFDRLCKLICGPYF